MGVNTLIMALPAVICYYLFRGLIWKTQPVSMAAGFGCGFLSVALGGVVVGAALMFSEGHFMEIAALVVGAHIPVMLIEGVVTAFCLAFLKRVNPMMLPDHTKP